MRENSCGWQWKCEMLDQIRRRRRRGTWSFVSFVRSLPACFQHSRASERAGERGVGPHSFDGPQRPSQYCTKHACRRFLPTLLIAYNRLLRSGYWALPGLVRVCVCVFFVADTPLSFSLSPSCHCHFCDDLATQWRTELNQTDRQASDCERNDFCKRWLQTLDKDFFIMM